MKIEIKLIYTAVFLSVSLFVYSQENNNDTVENEPEYIDFGINEGISIYRELPNPDEKYILSNLNGFSYERGKFIENYFIAEAGFRRTGNMKYRKTNGLEKTLSVLHGFASLLSFGIVPLKPFFEIDYDELSEGIRYSFESIIRASKYKDYSPEILIAMKLEYKLQIEFCNGILYQSNINYYTEKNIKVFEELALSLPDSSEAFSLLKERYLNIELPRIRAALERYKNPGEENLRALENLGGGKLKE